MSGCLLPMPSLPASAYPLVDQRHDTNEHVRQWHLSQPQKSEPASCRFASSSGLCAQHLHANHTSHKTFYVGRVLLANWIPQCLLTSRRVVVAQGNTLAMHPHSPTHNVAA